MSALLLATHNKGKIKELQSLLSFFETEIITPDQLELTILVEESGETYADNAALKAVAYARASRMLTLADDSGLEVDVLGGLPGIKSARFSSKPGAKDSDRRESLLQKLTSYPRPWIARFRCTVAIAIPSGELYFAEGVCPGEVIPEERGSGGFGYDPIFWLPTIRKTMAELSMEEKNRFSHRAMAVHAAIPILTELINTAP